MVEYTAGSNKGNTAQGDVFNSPLGLGKVDPDYTGEKVVETLGESLKLMWTPVASIVKAIAADGSVIDTTDWKVAEDGTVTGTGAVAGVKVAYV